VRTYDLVETLGGTETRGASANDEDVDVAVERQVSVRMLDGDGDDTVPIAVVGRAQSPRG
jgi:hypothetical protein